MSIAGAGSWNSISWPYPQVRFTDYYTIGLALDGTALKTYELINDNDIWTSSEIASLGTAANIDFVDVWGWGPFYAVVGSKLIGDTLTNVGFLRYPDGTITTLPNAAVPSFSAICDYNGQAIISGVNTTTSPWENLLLSSVCWSSIGGAFDFRINEAGNKTAGFIHIPGGGQGTFRTHRVLQLGKVVMVYTERGLHALVPHSIGRSGFGRVDYDFPGVKSGNHVAGSVNAHLYLSTENELVLINSKMEFNVLGYEEFMEQLNSDEIRISYVPSKKLFYISDSTTGYVLTEQGLYSCHQCVTSAGDYRGRVLCGFYYDNQDREPRLTTDTLDFNIRGLKTLVSVQTDTRSEGNVYASYQYKYNKQNTFAQSDWVLHNLEGISTNPITALEHRVRLKGVDYVDDDWSISRIDLKYKTADKRGFRGVRNAG